MDNAAHQATLTMGFFQARILEWVAMFFSRVDLSDPRIELVYPVLAGRFSTIESPGKPMHEHIHTPMLFAGVCKFLQ